MPAYYTMLAVSALLSALGKVNDVPWTTYLICLFYLSNIGGRGLTVKHSWSLSLEEQFYFMWPVFLKITNFQTMKINVRTPITLAVCIALELWRAFIIYSGRFEYHLAFRPDLQFDCIFVGCFLGLLWTYKRSTLQKLADIKIAKLNISDTALLAVLLLWTVYGAEIKALKPIYLTSQVWLIFLILTKLISGSNSVFCKILKNRILRWLGLISYSLYLWQQIFLSTNTPSWGIIRVFPISLLCVFLASLASYYFIEKPFRALNYRNSLGLNPPKERV
jgi:peptidoglycan/LPS O-acetylase OafA/YrhL